MNSLEQLKSMTTIVADTGDINAIKKHKPRDATTNPSLLLKAAKQSEYKNIIKDSVREAKARGLFNHKDIKLSLEFLAVNFAAEILEIIPGRVSIEADAALSFDTDATVTCAKRLISYLEDRGITRERVLIKISSTYEGIKAAEILEKEGIHCNLTLLFSFYQAVLCADAGVTLISPFVGRIYDFYKMKRGVEHIDPAEDPGVLSVKKIFSYFKTFDIKTEIMGASFRNIGEIKELAGCDLLTIAPNFLQDLKEEEGNISRRLDPLNISTEFEEKPELSESDFRWLLNEDEMATVKLSEGIRRFNADWLTLSEYVMEKFS